MRKIGALLVAVGLVGLVFVAVYGFGHRVDGCGSVFVRDEGSSNPEYGVDCSELDRRSAVAGVTGVLSIGLLIGGFAAIARGVGLPKPTMINDLA